MSSMFTAATFFAATTSNKPDDKYNTTTKIGFAALGKDNCLAGEYDNCLIGQNT